MVVTRDNNEPDSAEQCTFNVRPEWCRSDFDALRFDVQPSRVLYRVYVQNTGTDPVIVRVGVRREDVNRLAQVTLDAGETAYIWELGVQTVRIRTGSEIIP
jgi:hypothetical protein